MPDRRRSAGAALFGALAVTAAAPASAQDVQTIQMSQAGFETEGPKTATIVDASSRPLPWRVVNASGAEVAHGDTTVFGDDAASGEHVHIAAFQSLHAAGDGYRLIVGDHQSRPFLVADHPFAALKYDSLSYFYQTRAGVPITADHVARPDLARPAGHPHEVATCFSGTDMVGTVWPGCDYSLDVTGGWYDAGDQGKYVVNGGIAVWTLLNLYERAQQHAGLGASAFADGRADIPEAGNGVDDLLDEARYQIEFMLRMQIPDGARATVPTGQEARGRPLRLTEIDAGGMVHHKVHDAAWTTLPMPPADDPETRYLYPPSTGATLNLAAVGAQCARIWNTIDPAFAQTCLTAARRAFGAALRHPDVHAYNNFTGGGPYGDADFADEFYWAAAELFVTTGENLAALRTSPYFLGGPTSGTSATGEPSFNATAALGSLTLATVPSALPEADRAVVRANIAAAARSYVEEARTQGYGLPRTGTRYDWGSNSGVLNRAMILGAAFDYTGDWTYRNAVIASLDYILGRNPLDQSYVTGYGARPMRHPHHRFWAHSLNPALPEPPAGVLSGGPNNTNMSDDVARRLKGHCAPQGCWSDDIRAYTMNEVTINWNAPLVWVAAFLDDH